VSDVFSIRVGSIDRSVRAIERLRSPFSAHVRSGEHGHPSDFLKLGYVATLRPVTGALGVARDEGSPASVVAGVAAVVPAWLAALDAAQEPVAVAAAPVFPVVERADVAVPGGAAVPAAPAGVPVAVAAAPVFPVAERAGVAVPGGAAVPAAPAGVLSDAGEPAVLAVPASQA
jgi:hypothetical protein